ncbi:MAG: putative toxin-antitoxin system toxin component, PIN family [Bacteroidales bacterium]|mgnify:CR=1 FL=1|nr:putative toxin-antitoxin system toxin component, PIN family [Bacteroidales bacterium]
MINVVLDTNCLLMSLSSKGRYFSVWRDLLAGKYVLCLTNEILTEYEEILTQKIGKNVAGNIISAIMNLPNVKKVDVYFHFLLIKSDPDDDKFVDCAIKANAKYIVSEDRHYDVLREISFPKVDVIGIDEFIVDLMVM